MGVDPGRAALETLGDWPPPDRRRRPHRPAEAEVGGVGPGDGVVDVAVPRSSGGRGRTAPRRRCRTPSVTPARIVGSKKYPARSPPRRRPRRSPPSRASATSSLDPLVLRAVVERPELACRVRSPSPTLNAARPRRPAPRPRRRRCELGHVDPLDGRARPGRCWRRPARRLWPATSATSASSSRMTGVVATELEGDPLEVGGRGRGDRLPPVATEPVKLTLRGTGWAVIAAPRSSPPVTTLNTPGGQHHVEQLAERAAWRAA